MTERNTITDTITKEIKMLVGGADVTVDDTLEESGLSSIDMFSLYMFISEECQVELSPMSLRKEMTINELCDLIYEKRRNN